MKAFLALSVLFLGLYSAAAGEQAQVIIFFSYIYRKTTLLYLRCLLINNVFYYVQNFGTVNMIYKQLRYPNILQLSQRNFKVYVYNDNALFQVNASNSNYVQTNRLTVICVLKANSRQHHCLSFISNKTKPKPKEKKTQTRIK